MTNRSRTPAPVRPPAPPRRRRRDAGMTLMEMMVSITILAGMVMAFNIILSQSQRVVIQTQRRIRANAAAMAISQVIRRDVQNITKNGFLHIDAGQGLLAFSAAGVAESVTGDAKGNASIIAYRLCTNSVTSQKDVLCRIGIVLTRDATTTSSPLWPTGDRLQLELADIQTYITNGQLNANVITPLNGLLNVSLPPGNASDVADLWKVLTYHGARLNSEYGTRNATGAITWQGGTQTWDYRNQDNWPVAVKIKFTLAPNALERKAIVSATYEVVCPIAK